MKPRKPRRWIERLPLRCNDRVQIALAEDFGFEGYLRYVFVGPTVVQHFHAVRLGMHVYPPYVAELHEVSRVISG